jgi:hypothetical protein
MKTIQIIGHMIFTVAITATLASAGQTITWKCHFTRSSSPKGMIKEIMDTTFTLDPTKKVAYAQGNNGLDPVTPIGAKDGRSIAFIEITPNQNVMVTTIDEHGTAVHSRGTVINGILVPSQFYGTCTIK